MNPMRNKDIKKALDGYFAVLSSYQPVYSTYAGGIYEMELTRASIHCFANHCSKLRPEVIGNASPALGRVLQYQPNPLMDTKKYLYRLATAYMTDNNALIAPLLEFDEIKGFYPLVVGKVQLMDYDGQTYVRYDMGGGEYFVVELSRCGIINQFQYTSELWGESNLCLRPTLELIEAQNQGIINGIKNSAVIRFIAKLANSLKSKDVKAEQDRLKEINLGISNTAGVFVIDQKYEDVKQIDSKPYIINPSQMEYIKQNVFNYFGTNEHILQNKFTPDEWNAYYEGKIEPFALEIGLVHTNMTFSEREKSFGNQIFFSSNRLQYASISDKINYVVQMGDRGRTSINEDREVFNLPPIEDGDRHFIRGEYRPVDSYEGTELTSEIAEGDALPPISDNTVDKGGRGGIIEAREPVFGDGHKIVDNKSEGGDEGGADDSKNDGSVALSIYFNSSEDLYKYAKKVEPENGYEDVFIHGDKTGFSYNDKNGNEAGTYSPKEFADILKSDPNYKGGNIRLFSCETGAEGATAAQDLSNCLGVEIKAPTDIVWIDFEGKVSVGPDKYTNTGSWVVKTPQTQGGA